VFELYTTESTVARSSNLQLENLLNNKIAYIIYDIKQFDDLILQNRQLAHYYVT